MGTHGIGQCLQAVFILGSGVVQGDGGGDEERSV